MMALIIDFAYTGSVSITEKNAVELLMAADQLNVMDIVKLCCDFLGEQLCPENCVGIWQFTKVCLLPELRAKAYHYIINNFEQVVLEEEFLQLTVEEVADILDREDLNVQLETTVYEALIKWISHVPAEREQHLTALLSKIYICGGFNGNECLQTAEYYNPETNQWTMISPMNSRRSGIGVIAYADHVFAVGGFDGNN
uniref:BACK domain-containing protein n=1 Tax=Oreochromis aureus TaxID=47969 RepID=A0AAZ1XVV0_OREAU